MGPASSQQHIQVSSQQHMLLVLHSHQVTQETSGEKII